MLSAFSEFPQSIPSIRFIVIPGVDESLAGALVHFRRFSLPEG
jgi:hypothetical protein